MRLAIVIIILAFNEVHAADCRTEMQRSDRILECHVHDQWCDTVKCEYIGNCGEQFDQSGCLAALRYLADGLGTYFCDRQDKWNISSKKQDVIEKICGTSKGASMQKPPHPEPIMTASKTLGEAAKDGDVATIRRLVSQGTDINAPDKEEHTPLMIASMWGQVAALEVLLDSGADVSLATKSSGLTALMLAAREGRVGSIKTLLDTGAQLDARSSAKSGNFTAVFVATTAGQVDALKVLVSAGADVNTTDSGQTTPLIRASEHADVAMVQALLAAGADVNARDRNGYSALDWVPIRGGDRRNNAKVRALLMNAGARK